MALEEKWTSMIDTKPGYIAVFVKFDKAQKNMDEMRDIAQSSALSYFTDKVKREIDHLVKLYSKVGQFGVLFEKDYQGGAKIKVVLSGGAALHAKMKNGDIIVKLNDANVANDKALRTKLSKFHPGHEISLLIKRGQAEPFEVKVTLRG